MVDSWVVDGDGGWDGPVLQLPTIATAVGPLIAEGTDATPGSVPLAAVEPTRAGQV